MSGKKRENKFQAELIAEIQERLPDALVTKFDGKQGWPDILIFYNDRWAALECKREQKSGKQPNQEYYVRRMNEMSFSRFIFPENKGEVLNELEQALQARRSTRSTRSKQTKLGDG